MRTNLLTLAAVVTSLGVAGLASAQTTNSTPYQPPMAGTYDLQQPMAGSYQLQQPMTGTYQLQQPMTGNYQLQQPMTGSYQLQQPMTGNYGLEQPMTGSYTLQQPLPGSSFNTQSGLTPQQQTLGTGGSGIQTTVPGTGAINLQPGTGTTTLPGSLPIQQPNAMPLPSTQPGGSTTGVR